MAPCGNGIGAMIKTGNRQAARVRRPDEDSLPAPVFDTLSEAICVVGLAGRVTLSNQAFRSVLQMADGETLRGQPVEFVSARLAERITSGFRDLSIPLNLVRQGADVTCEAQEWVCRDGTVLEARLHACEEHGLVLSCFEVTARKAVELQLIAAKEQADFANRSKSQFLANMTHELRTPLNAIIGFSEILTGEILGPLGDTRYLDYARDIYTSGTHLLDIINDILDLARIDVGGEDLIEKPTSVSEVFESVTRMLRDKALDGQVELRLSLPPKAPMLLVDERALKQMLLNLLSNAIKFTLPGGIITIAFTPREDASIVTVTDTGIGMDPAEIPKALAPFGQLDGALNRRFTGTGLGLPLVRALAEQHGGHLDITSAPGVGTRAAIVLPASRAIEVDLAVELGLAAAAR